MDDKHSIFVNLVNYYKQPDNHGSTWILTNDRFSFSHRRLNFVLNYSVKGIHSELSAIRERERERNLEAVAESEEIDGGCRGGGGGGGGRRGGVGRRHPDRRRAKLVRDPTAEIGG